jgi:hypothetical protein
LPVSRNVDGTGHRDVVVPPESVALGGGPPLIRLTLLLMNTKTRTPRSPRSHVYDACPLEDTLIAHPLFAAPCFTIHTTHQ